MANTTVGNVIFQDLSNSFIRENAARKEALLTPLPLYLMDSDETDVFDFGGTIKIITLIGIFVGDTEAAVKTFVDSAEALIQGNQDTNAGYPLTFKDDRRGTLKVKIMDFESVFVEGFPTAATWVLKIIQSSTNA